MEIFTYDWHHENKEDDLPYIRVYGIDENGHTVCLRIAKFHRYVYVELPNEKCVSYLKELAEKRGAVSVELQYKHHLYYYKKQTFPFLKCSFLKLKDVYRFTGDLRFSVEIPHCGKTKIRVHEQLASPVLQLIATQKIKMSGWLQFSGKPVVNQMTRCDREYIVDWKKLKPGTKTIGVNPKILSFDIEVNSENDNCMPCNKPGDVVFQISCVMEDKKILLSLGNAEVPGAEVRLFETEQDLLDGFIDLLTEEKPNVITGYNILGFDIPYLMKRYNRFFLIDEFKSVGFNKKTIALEKEVKWSSSAFRDQHFKFINWEGVLILDLLPIVMRDYKLDNYKLHTVATKFVDAGKDPLTAKDLFAAYRSGELSEVGKYCMKDSQLVYDLICYFKSWVAFSEMAKVCNVSMFTLYTQGQQIKIYSQVYYFCFDKNIVVDTDGYTAASDERYTGAHVIEPVPGYYENVVPFDFNSLYPNLIIAYNICYSTMITNIDDVPENERQTFEWEDHVGCEHDPKVIKAKEMSDKINEIKARQKKLRDERDSVKAKPGVTVAYQKAELQKRINVIGLETKPFQEIREDLVKSKPKFPICAKRSYTFYRPEVRVGIIPTIIKDLLDSRKKVRAEIKKTDDPLTKIIYDKQQLAYKVSANSMYGGMGAQRGMLVFMPGAMCVTYLGRKSIEKAAHLIQTEWRGELVYGDTDSNYVIFPHITTKEELWDYCLKVADNVSAQFPGQMRLEFEATIYVKFLILSKKRYMYQECGRDGTLNPKVGKKGVLLARRDNSAFIREVYEKLTNLIFDRVDEQTVCDYITEQLDKMYSNTIDTKKYIITKAIGSTEGDIDEDTKKLGTYKVKELPTDTEEREKLLAGRTEREYYIASCPAQVRLAEKMRNRGNPVDAGSRIEFVIFENFEAKTQREKIEEYEYFKQRKRALKIDFTYYCQSLAKPLDQLLKVGLGKPNLMGKLVSYRINKKKMINQLNAYFKPKIVLK